MKTSTDFPKVMVDAVDSMNYWFLKRVTQRTMKNDAEVGRFLLNVSNESFQVKAELKLLFAKEFEDQEIANLYDTVEAFKADVETALEHAIEEDHDEESLKRIVAFYMEMFKEAKARTIFSEVTDVLLGQAEWTETLQQQIHRYGVEHAIGVEWNEKHVVRDVLRKKEVGEHFGGPLLDGVRTQNGLKAFERRISDVLEATEGDASWKDVSSKLTDLLLGRYAELEMSHPMAWVVSLKKDVLDRVNRLIQSNEIPCSKEMVKEYEQLDAEIREDFGSIALGYEICFSLRGSADGGYYVEIYADEILFSTYDLMDGVSFRFGSEEEDEESIAYLPFDPVTKTFVRTPEMEILIQVEA